MYTLCKHINVQQFSLLASHSSFGLQLSSASSVFQINLHLKLYTPMIGIQEASRSSKRSKCWQFVHTVKSHLGIPTWMGGRRSVKRVTTNDSMRVSHWNVWTLWLKLLLWSKRAQTSVCKAYSRVRRRNYVVNSTTTKRPHNIMSENHATGIRYQGSCAGERSPTQTNIAAIIDVDQTVPLRNKRDRPSRAVKPGQQDLNR